MSAHVAGVEALARARAGMPVDERDLPVSARPALRLARHLGAPLVPALEAAIRAGLAADELRRAVEVAAAEGRAVARGLVYAPPVVGPLAALLVADDPLAAWGTAPGRVALVVAAVLWAAGWAVVRLLVARALPSAASPSGGDAALFELAAVALDAGLALPMALREAAVHAGREQDVADLVLWLELGGAAAPPSGWEHTGPLLARARRDGTPQSALLRGLAAAARRDDHHAAMQRAARLGTRLTLPTTLLLLPAAGLVVIVPLVHAAVVAAT